MSRRLIRATVPPHVYDALVAEAGDVPLAAHVRSILVDHVGVQHVAPKPTPQGETVSRNLKG